MTDDEARYIRAMARKIHSHAQAIVLTAVNLDVPLNQYNNIPMERIRKRFSRDLGYGIQDHIESMLEIVGDLLKKITPDEQEGPESI